LISVRSPGRQVAENGHSQEFVRVYASASDLNEAMRSTAESIVPRPEDTKSQFLGTPHGEIDELITASWRYRDEDLWAMDQSASECRAPLCGWEQPPGKLIFEVRNSAEVEHLKGSGAGGAGICAADAKERHGHVLR
jgi:hypothetical protein